MKIKNKHEQLKAMIEKLHEKGREKGVWEALARALNKPRRNRYEVNLFRLEKYARDGNNIVVPGIVLGSGELTKKINVIALKFSDRAREKIERAGGKCLPIEDVFKFKPNELRIMG